MQPAHAQREYEHTGAESNGTVFFAEHATERDDAVFRALTAGGYAVRPRTGAAFAEFRARVGDAAVDATYWRVAYAGAVCNYHVIVSAASATASRLTFRCGPDEPVTIWKGAPGMLAGALCAACDVAGEDVVATITHSELDEWAALGFEQLDGADARLFVRRNHKPTRASFGGLYTV